MASPVIESFESHFRNGSEAEIQTAYVTKSGWTPDFSHATSRLRPSMSVLPSLSRMIGKAKHARFDVGRKLVELVIGEHRK
jgi:hypothetical protein